MHKADREKRRLRAFLAVSLFLTAAVVFYGVERQLSEPSQQVAKPQTGITGMDGAAPRVSLEELGEDFMSNAEAAVTKYKGKVVTVTGTGWTEYFDFYDAVRMIYRGKTNKTWEIELEFHLPKDTIAATQAALKQAERQLRIDYDRQREAFAAGTAPKSPVAREHAVITMSGICREIEWTTDLPGAKRATMRFAKGKLMRIAGQLK